MITFHHASNLARQLGEMLTIAQPNNPAHRDHWARLDDTPEGRAELRRRCQMIFAAAGQSSQWTGEGRVALLAQFAKEHLDGNG
jgi:hypothetical protein